MTPRRSAASRSFPLAQSSALTAEEVPAHQYSSTGTAGDHISSIFSLIVRFLRLKKTTSTLLATSLWVCTAESLLEPSNGWMPAAQQHHPSPAPRRSSLLTSLLACRTPQQRCPGCKARHQEHQTWQHPAYILPLPATAQLGHL